MGLWNICSTMVTQQEPAAQVCREAQTFGEHLTLTRTIQLLACPCPQIYDARALRVIIANEEGGSVQEAIPACYRLVSAVHSIWKPIKKEFDDYVANPKPSGYQALHTGVDRCFDTEYVCKLVVEKS